MNWSKLRKQVAASLNIDELRSLCFDLEIDYDSLSGEGKEGKVRELIALMRRNNDVSRLIKYLSALRPNIQWVEILSTESHRETSQNTDLDEEEEEGVLDYALTIVEAGNRLVTLMNAAGKAADLLSDKMEANTKQLLSTPNNDFHKAHNIASKIALDHETFAIDIENIAVETTESWQSFRKAYSPFFILESENIKQWLSISKNPDTYINNVVNARTTFISVSNKIQNLWLNVQSARSTLSQLRGLSRDLNRAISKTDQVLGKYMDTLDEIRKNLNKLSNLSGEFPSLIDNLREQKG